MYKVQSILIISIICIVASQNATANTSQINSSNITSNSNQTVNIENTTNSTQNTELILKPISNSTVKVKKEEKDNKDKINAEKIPIKEIHIGDTLQQVIKENNKLFFKVKIDKVIPDEDFIVITSPFQQLGGDPDIYLSTSVEYPGLKFIQEGVKGCFSIQYDVCVLKQNELQENSYVYIGISCYKNCSFNLEIRYQQEISIKLGEDVLQYFSKESHAKIFKVKIPEQTSTGHSIGHIAFSVEPINIKDFNETFNLFVKKGIDQAPTTAQYDLKGKSSWYNGKTAAVYKGSRNFCTNCVYTLLVEAPVNSLIRISVWTDDEIIDLRLKEKQVDALDSEGIIYYKLILEGDQSIDFKTIQQNDIELELDPYSGSLLIYINPDTKPTKLEDYHWKINEDTKTKFILKPSERQKAKASDKIYYIALKAKFTATFSFSASLNNMQDTITTYLEFGITHSEDLEDNQFSKLQLPLTKINDTNITLKVFNEKGTTDIYVLFCNYSTNSTCEITKEQISQIQKGESLSNLVKLKTRKLFAGQVINEFEYKQQECGSSNHLGICSYAIAVYCKGTCQYHITPYALGQHLQLKEGEVEHFSLKSGQQMHYKFGLEKYDKSIDCVKFNLNAISGYPRLYISRIFPYPDISHNEHFTLFESDSIYFSYNQLKKNITGPYYITATTENSDCYFTLSVQVIRLEKISNDSKQLKLTTKYVHLLENAPITQSLHFLKEQNHLYFDVDLPNDFKGEIQINLSPISGQFDVYISTQYKNPQLEQATWITQGDFQTSIHIKHNDKQFKAKGRYYVTIEVEESFSNILQEFLYGTERNQELEGDFRYTIQYNIKATSGELAEVVQEVHEGLPIDGKLTEKSVKTYFVKIPENSKKLTLILYILTDLAQIITYKTKVDNNYVDSKNEVHQQSAIIEYNQDELTKLCAEEVKSHQECKLYIDLINPYTHKLDYTLSIQRNKEIGERYTLREGKPLFVPFPQPDEYIHIVYQPSTVFNGITITATSKTGDVEILINAYDRIRLGQLKDYAPQFKFPTSTKDSEYYSIHQTFTTSQSIFIKPETIHCGVDCIFAITIKENVMNVVVPNDKEYITVIASTELQQLQDGQSAHGFVQKSTFKYYYFTVNQQEVNIYIHLTGLLDTDPTLYVTYGIDTKPTLTKFDWVSQKSKGQPLHITKSNFRGFNITKTMAGTYVIGVYGNTDSTFVLTSTYSNTSIIDLQSGFPFEFDLNEGQTIYFNYYHYLNESFTVNGVIDYGIYNIYINTYTSTEQYLFQKIPNQNNFKWSNMYIATAFTKDFVRISKNDPSYCVGCGYLISLKALPNEKVKGTLLVKVDTEHIFLQPGKPFHDIVDKETYTYYTALASEGSDISIRIKVHFGNPIFYVSSSFQFDKSNPKKADYVLSVTRYGDDHIKDYIHLDLPYAIIHEKYCTKNILCSIYSYIVFVDPNGEDVHYTITVAPKDKEILLKEGLQHIDKLTSGQTQQYEIYSNEVLNNQQKFNILIHSFDYEHQQNIFNESLLPYADVIFEKKIKGIEVPITRVPTISANITNPQEHFIHYQIQAEQGKYVINIINPHKFDIKYSILVQTHEISAITSDEKTYSLISDQEEHLYEISVETPGLLVIRLIECFGSVQIYLGDSLHNISRAVNNSNYKPHLDIVDYVQEQSQDIYVIKIDIPTLIYALIIFEEGLVTSPLYKPHHKQAYFKLTTKLVPQVDINLFKLWKLGFKGNIIHSQNKDYEVNFTWTPPYFTKDKKQQYIHEDKSLEYFYTIYFGRDPQYINLVSRCGDTVIGSGQSQLVQLDKTLFHKEIQCNQTPCIYSQQFSEEEKSIMNILNDENIDNFLNNQLYATIRVDYKVKGEKYYNSEQYQINEFFVLHKPTKSSNSIFVLIIVAVLFVVVGVLGWKYKTVKQKLIFEMQDIRNIARIGIGRPAGYTTQVSTLED